MAVDFGITHFDTSPLYGFGHAEMSLRKVLKEFPELTVTSKLGLYPPGDSQKSYFEILSRKLGGKLVPSLSKTIVDFTIEKANFFLETSLKNLGRDCLDLVLIHDPVRSVLDCDEWHSFLMNAKKKGLVKHFGVDGGNSLPNVADLARNRPELCPIIQCRDNLRYSPTEFREQLCSEPNITYGYIADALFQGSTNSSPVKLDPVEAFSIGLGRFKNSAVIASTTNGNHLQDLVRVVDEIKPQ